MMRPNKMRSIWENGGVAYGAWISTSAAVNAEAASRAGYDYVNVDMQHGLIDYSDLPPALLGIGNGDATTTARVPWNEPGMIGKALDAGSQGVIIPMVNTVEQCEAAVRSCYYAPIGSRSYGPVRAAMLEGDDYFEVANDSIMCIPMIETAEAVSNIDGILSVPGVDAIYVGPADLAVSHGIHPRRSAGVPDFENALDTIVERCNHHGVVPGIHANAAIAAERADRGFRMITITADLVSFRERLTADLGMVRGDEEGEAGEASLY